MPIQSQATANFNPWHHVHFGDEAPEFVNAIIEIPSGSKGKFELDKTTGLLKLDRVLFSAVHYPANYGFIPRTYCDDKDPLDILVITSIELPHLCQVEAKVVGVMRMVDQGEADDKIIAVAANDMSVNHIEEINQLPIHTINQIQRFFEDYKKLEHKEVVVENFLDRLEAYKIIKESIQLYKDTFLW
jgi:inorganic pyrophosphatase